MHHPDAAKNQVLSDLLPAQFGANWFGHDQSRDRIWISKYGPNQPHEIGCNFL